MAILRAIITILILSYSTMAVVFALLPFEALTQTNMLAWTAVVAVAYLVYRAIPRVLRRVA